jgi:hypothetical protein
MPMVGCRHHVQQSISEAREEGQGHDRFGLLGHDLMSHKRSGTSDPHLQLRT